MNDVVVSINVVTPDAGIGLDWIAVKDSGEWLTSKIPPRVWSILPSNTVAASNVASWVDSHYVVDIAALAPNPRPTEFFLPVEAILNELLADLEHLDARIRPAPVARALRSFIFGPGRALASGDVKCAIFADDEAVNLVAHSRYSRRQVSFEFSDDGETITLVRIDEHMKRTVQTCRRTHVLQIGQAINWLDAD